MIGDRHIPSVSALGASAPSVAGMHMDSAFRHMLRGPCVVAEGRFIRLLTGAPHPFGNFTFIADADDASGAAAAIEPLVGCGAPAAALFPRPVGAALLQRLRAAGFEAHEPMAAMVVDIDALAPTSLPPGYSFARIGAGPEGDRWALAFTDGYELPRSLAAQFSPTILGASSTSEREPMQFFAVIQAGRIVCTSVLHLADGVAGIYCVATVPEARRQGLAAHATAEPLRLARELGFRVGALQSSPAGHTVYLRLGFTDVGEVPLFVRLPEAS